MAQDPERLADNEEADAKTFAPLGTETGKCFEDLRNLLAGNPTPVSYTSIRT